MRVLVTGGAGRLGRSVLATLRARGHRAICLDRRALADGHGVESVTADLSLPGEIRTAIADYRPEGVVHLAAIPVPFSEPEGQIYRTNTQLAFDVCHASVEHGAEAVVIASSPTVVGYGNPVGWAPQYLPIDEGHRVAPWNAYALSKLAAEDIMRMFARQTHDRVRFAAVRPCFVIAPEEWAGAPTQTGVTVRERLDTPELAAASLFNYVDARDAAELMVTILHRARSIPNAQVFFASAEDALAREPLAELLPKFQPETAPYAVALTGTTPAFSTTKAQRLLGWAARLSWRTEIASGA